MIRAFRFPTGRRSVRALALFAAASGLLFAGCGKKEAPAPRPPSAATAPAAVCVAPSGSALYLAEAQFVTETDASGKSRSVPGPARLSIWTSNGSGWTEEVVEDPESNVFHKALWYAPPSGEPGILTIGATRALLKIWRKTGGRWVAETLWNPVFGGKWDRLRDVEVVAVVSWTGSAWKAEELARRENTFVHEVETGDIDGDGVAEIFSTPSLPNKLDGTPQPGEIDMFRRSAGKWERRIVETLPTRHAKEILCVTLDGETRPVLFASLEGENLGGASDQGDNTRIRLYRFDGGAFKGADIAGLPGNLCRFLTYGDTDGDGSRELIASTKSNGIWKLTPPEQPGTEWRKTMIATGTSGFEHATFLADLDGDGKSEIYVASDDQGELRCYGFEDGAYRMKTIGPLRGKPITFNLTAHKP